MYRGSTQPNWQEQGSARAQTQRGTDCAPRSGNAKAGRKQEERSKARGSGGGSKRNIAVTNLLIIRTPELTKDSSRRTTLDQVCKVRVTAGNNQMKTQRIQELGGDPTVWAKGDKCGAERATRRVPQLTSPRGNAKRTRLTRFPREKHAGFLDAEGEPPESITGGVLRGSMNNSAGGAKHWRPGLRAHYHNISRSKREGSTSPVKRDPSNRGVDRNVAGMWGEGGGQVTDLCGGATHGEQNRTRGRRADKHYGDPVAVWCTWYPFRTARIDRGPDNVEGGPRRQLAP